MGSSDSNAPGKGVGVRPGIDDGRGEGRGCVSVGEGEPADRETDQIRWHFWMPELTTLRGSDLRLPLERELDFEPRRLSILLREAQSER